MRALLILAFYIQHVAQKGDILIIDEPELNLHPENQRRMARIFARLINFGIKIVITTHSDYIVKELNTLIMFNQKTPQLKKIAKEEGYSEEEFISHTKVRLYTAEKGTLTPASIDEKSGINAKTFNITIDNMNHIHHRIFWEGDDNE